MSPRKMTIKLLKENGFVESREGANHTIFYNPETRRRIPVKRHDFNDNDMKYVLKEAGIKK